MLGTTPRALLFYEEQGILEPKRTSRGTRFYSEADIKRFAIAHQMVALGIPIKTVRKLATIRPAAASGKQTSRQLCPIVDELVAQLERQIEDLAALKKDLQRGSELIRTCWDCEKRPGRLTCPECPCELHLEESELLRLTWDPDRD